MYVAIIRWDADGRVNKFQDYTTEAEARAHVERFKVTFPAAFVIGHPGGSPRDWIADSIAKTVTISPLPPRVPTLAEKMAPYEGAGIVARKVEDMVVDMIATGRPLPAPVKTWTNARRALRGEPPL